MAVNATAAESSAANGMDVVVVAVAALAVEAAGGTEAVARKWKE